MKARSKPKRSDLWSTYCRRLERRRKSRRWENYEEVLFSGKAIHSVTDLQDQLLEVAESTFELWWRLEAIRIAAQYTLPPIDHDVELFPTRKRKKPKTPKKEECDAGRTEKDVP